jgi:hypothetical protein
MTPINRYRDPKVTTAASRNSGQDRENRMIKSLKIFMIVSSLVC